MQFQMLRFTQLGAAWVTKSKWITPQSNSVGNKNMSIVPTFLSLVKTKHTFWWRILFWKIHFLARHCLEKKGCWWTVVVLVKKINSALDKWHFFRLSCVLEKIKVDFFLYPEWTFWILYYGKNSSLRYLQSNLLTWALLFSSHFSSPLIAPPAWQISQHALCSNLTTSSG